MPFKLSSPLTIDQSPPKRSTSAKFIWCEEKFVTALRTRCRAEKTSVAAILVAAGLVACRSTFESHDRYAKRFPTHQGWVLTNSLRHLIPGNGLIKGVDKHDDPSTSIFGSYSGSGKHNFTNCKCRIMLVK